MLSFYIVMGQWYLCWFSHYVLVHTFFQPSILSSCCFQFLSQVIKALLISTGHANTDRFCSLVCSHLSALNGGRLRFTLYSSFLINHLHRQCPATEICKENLFPQSQKAADRYWLAHPLFTFFGVSFLVQSNLMFIQFGGISRGRMIYYMKQTLKF